MAGSGAQRQPDPEVCSATAGTVHGDSPTLLFDECTANRQSYIAQSKYAEAEPRYRRALAIREKALGLEHPAVAESLYDLAELYHAQGKYGEAEPGYRRAIAILENALGPKHPDVATVLESLAVVLRKTNRTAEAQKIEARARMIKAQHALRNMKGNSD